MEDKFLTVKEVSDYLQLGINKTYSLFKYKGFPCVKFGSSYRVRKDDLLNYLAANKGNTFNI